jgi:hypothetical protein
MTAIIWIDRGGLLGGTQNFHPLPVELENSVRKATCASLGRPSIVDVAAQLFAMLFALGDIGGAHTAAVDVALAWHHITGFLPSLDIGPCLEVSFDGTRDSDVGDQVWLVIVVSFGKLELVAGPALAAVLAPTRLGSWTVWMRVLPS